MSPLMLVRAVAKLQELARDGDRQLEVRGVLRGGEGVLALQRGAHIRQRLEP
jgi:hypothetical protein